MMMSSDTNTIVIVETHSYTQFYMFAYRWDGSEWNLIGNILNVNPGNAFIQAVSISGDGNTIVASGLNPYETGGEAFALLKMVGTTGFEPATPTTPLWCATRLRHVPETIERRFRVGRVK